MTTTVTTSTAVTTTVGSIKSPTTQTTTTTTSIRIKNEIIVQSTMPEATSQQAKLNLTDEKSKKLKPDFSSIWDFLVEELRKVLQNEMKERFKTFQEGQNNAAFDTIGQYF